MSLIMDFIGSVFNWIRHNKLASFLLFIIGWAVWVVFGTVATTLTGASYGTQNVMEFGGSDISYAPSASTGTASNALYSKALVPSTGGGTYVDSPMRKVETRSSMSLLVKSVKQTVDSIQTLVEKNKGFVVQKNISTPEFGETGYIVVRVPNETRDNILNKFREDSVRVVSENISANDITDQYKDIQARLETLGTTKAIYENMLVQTKNIDEILRVQSMIFQIQDQVDSLKGQVKYMEGSSSTSLITINLSTDEMSLPYAASPWKPEAKFKEAVRALTLTLRSIANLLIWVTVYSVLWIPALLALSLFKKYMSKRNAQKENMQLNK